ncbi:hypothetical protein BT96DRAFT_932758 [Gymnopus androsaceus JB14]|uniref:Uncharacterized protein n=1 Tax=Gymnopus androsaceus JB14 TaxID=1447944 RepID=A0A6A4IDM7_9AGAR|nr:hypothetical protein BT96DRAFT_932758 [Gymnopus androsaceus JB14]
MFIFQSLSTAVVLLQLVTGLVYALPAPVAPVAPETHLLERRTNPGMYMIVTPDPTTDVVQSVKSERYLMYIKFGDGKVEDDPAKKDREGSYSSHNPSYVFKGADVHDNPAKQFEDILKNNKNGGPAPSSKGFKREWYFVYLGPAGTKLSDAKKKADEIVAIGKDGMNKAQAKSEAISTATARTKATAEKAYEDALKDFKAALKKAIE